MYFLKGSVANWPKYRPKNTKLAHKNLSGRKKWRANFLQIFQKMAEKWPNFFVVCSSHKRHDYLQK
jgi:hypothetical protein